MPGKWKSGRGSTLGVPPVCAEVALAIASSDRASIGLRKVMGVSFRMSDFRRVPTPAKQDTKQRRAEQTV